MRNFRAFAPPPVARALVLAAALACAALLAGCGGAHAGRRAGAPSRTSPGQRARELPRALPLEILSDRAPDASLPPAHVGGAPPASLVLLRIAPMRSRLAPPPPDAAPAEPPAAGESPERLPADARLRPPVPRSGTSLRLAGARRGWVELDVRVDETGAVSNVELAGADADSALVRAAIAAARATLWYPAQLSGKSVAVWSRQRFELAR